MAVLIVDKQYQDGQILTESQLDAAFNSIAILLNTTGLGADNIQDNSIGVNELQTSSVSNTKLATDSVSTNKIQDGAITLAKLATTLQNFLVPTGTIVPYMGLTAPAGWLICDGTPVSRTTYAALFAVIDVKCGGGDGTATFNLPDGKGRVIRMVDGSAGRDPDSATRTAMNTGGAAGNNIGSVQDDDFKLHTHTASTPGSGSSSGGASGTFQFGQSPGGAVGASVSSTGGQETRMKNFNANMIIKY